MTAPPSPGSTGRTAQTALHLRDFTVGPRVAVVTFLSVLVGAVASVAALLLVRGIALATGLVFAQRVTTQLLPVDHLPWPLMLVTPAAGGLVIGLMARYGSERIRGHGTPETIEAVLSRGSLIAPRVAVLKPLSAVVAIGTGGPFGAEGPVIATGGALGSLLAQFLELTADERKVLLVSGAAAGMSAVFGTPLAALLFALELLLFEYRPRSLVPVAAAAVTAALLRPPLLGSEKLLPAPVVPTSVSFGVVLGCLSVGLLAGVLAIALTRLVSLSEQAFARLPLHWMWWPALGGLLIGAGGVADPHALGVGYFDIGQLLLGRTTWSAALLLLAVKAIIWAGSLGSGTSGGVVAPVLLLGAALGGTLAPALPGPPGLWALAGLAAVLAGTLRAPLTAVVFAFELTGRAPAVLPLLLSVLPAYGLSTVLQGRGVLTERMAHRGLHARVELDVDPLETVFVHEAMTRDVETLPGALALSTAVQSHRQSRTGETGHRQRLYPVLDHHGLLLGVVTLHQLIDAALAGTADGTVADIALRQVVTARADETLRTVAYRMAQHGVTRVPVVAGDDPRRVVGVLSLGRALEGRLRDLREAQHSERFLRLRRRPAPRDRIHPSPPPPETCDAPPQARQVEDRVAQPPRRPGT